VHAAEVPAAHVAKIAKAVLDQFGRDKLDEVTKRLGGAGASHEADVAHRTLNATGLRANVAIKAMSEPCKGLPVCYMTDYVSALASRGQLNRLCAGLSDIEMLRANSKLWELLRVLYPTHEVFACFDDPAHPAQPETTFACDIHTDEGRGQKKVPMMCISSAASLGIGTLKQRATRSLPDKLALNFAGQTCGNRMVHVVAPKSYYDTDDSTVFQAMCGHIAINCRLLLDEGFEYKGRTWCVAYIATLGDWPAHIKNGNFLRSFLNGVKNASQTEEKLKGICHICCAGIAGVPWEDVRLTAKSLQTIGLVEAWDEDSAFLPLCTYSGQRHLCFPPDIWHGWALGWGKETSASSVVATLRFYPGSKADDRVAAANANLQAYLKTSGDSTSFAVLSRSKLGWESELAFPKGSWSKAEDTRIILQWQIKWLQTNRESWHGDKMLEIVLPAFQAIDSVFSSLYSHGYFIPGHDGLVIAKNGLSFLNMMQDCIKLCMLGGEGPLNLFKQQPKMHMMFHAFAQMHIQCEKCGFCQNPLSQSCQMPEDLIGKVCRLSRRVDYRLVSKRTLQCYLICAGMQWLIPYVYED